VLSPEGPPASPYGEVPHGDVPMPGEGAGSQPPGAAAEPGLQDMLPGELRMEAEGDALFADPKARKAVLDELYRALADTHDTAEAERIETAISAVWHRTGSPTVDLLLQHAEAFEEESDHDTALQILDAAIELDPDAAEAWHQRAMVHFLRDEHSEALADLRHVLALDPKHYEAISGLGRVLEHLGKKKQALDVFRRALKVNPHLDPARNAVEELSREVEGQDI
jgi:tetratricopeptide (TPR) repeat protein